MTWPTGDPCPGCGELMDVGAVGNPGETITWQECEDCEIGWGPFTGFVVSCDECDESVPLSRALVDGELDEDPDVTCDECADPDDRIMTDGGSDIHGDAIDRERPREESPWFCPHCELWCGWKTDQCSGGHRKPRLALRYDDVPFDAAWKVTRRDRLRGAIRSLRSALAKITPGRSDS